MIEQALELPLLWLEESDGAVAFMAAAFGIAVAGFAAWMRSVAQLRERSGTHSVLDYAHGLIALHTSIYNAIAGTHPHRRLWHSQWLSVKDLYADFRPLFLSLTGRVLDVGCLGKPYAVWLTNAECHFGLDVRPSPTTDLVIRPDEQWDLDPASFDAAICTQVIQVVRDPEDLIGQIERALKPGGVAIFTTPFTYNDMSLNEGGRIYKDYWRHSVYGLQELLSKRFEIVECRRQGGFGSTAGVMLLNWIQFSFTRRYSTHLLFTLLLPLWLPFCLMVNVGGWVLDRCDRTGGFYHNVMVVARKKG